MATTGAASEYVTLEPKDEMVELFPDYSLRVEPGEFLFIEFGEIYGTPGLKFSHPAVLHRSARVFEFKTTYPNGRKRWYGKPGVAFLLAFRKRDVKFRCEKGYSFPSIRIGDVDFRLNVSGGALGNGWTDIIRRVVEAPVGMGLRRLRRLAQYAVLPAEVPAELIERRELAADERDAFVALCARVDGVKSIRGGHKIAVVGGAVAQGGCDLNSLVVNMRCGSARRFLAFDKNGCIAWVPYDLVDWPETLRMNGIRLVDPDRV